MRSAPVPLLLLAACHLGVADEVREVPHDSVPRADTGTPEPTDTGERDPFERDDDGDGWSENAGDCDDGDAARHPEQDDPCNGVDDDCDGTLDEDAADPWEPNDEIWLDLGDLDATGSLSLSATLTNDDDLDRYSFYVDDPWYADFGFEVRVTGIPAEARYRLTLGRVEEDGALSDTQVTYGGDSLSLTRTGTAGVDDAGTYGVVVDALGGADCARSYLLSVTGG
ncbi:MAG: putative metal-binding motif-containing protein [Pseudomonadota bacterium]